MNFVTWIIANWASVAQIIASVIATATIIVKITPTLKDDNILLPIVKFIGKWIALDKYGAGTVKRPN